MTRIHSLDDLDSFCRIDAITAFGDHPFWNIRFDAQHYAFMAAVDSLWLADLQISRLQDRISSRHAYTLYQQQKLQENAISHIARWLPPTTNTHVHTAITLDDLDAAGDLIRKAVPYATLDSARQYAKAGFLRAEFDTSTNTVTFQPAETAGHVLSTLAELDADLSDESIRAAWDRDDNLAWSISHAPKVVIHNGRVAILDHNQLGTMTNRDFLATAICPTDLHLLSPHTRIQCISIAEYNLIWATLRRWSRTLLSTYCQLADADIAQNEILPTYVGRTSYLIESVHRATGVNRGSIRQVIDWLSWYPGKSDGDVFLQPFFRLGSNCIWSARTVLGSHPVRNLLKRLTKDPNTANDVATVVGERSSALSRAVADLFISHGYVAYAEARYCANGLRGDWDVLAWNPHEPSQLLVLECKAYLTPDDPQEIIRLAENRLGAEMQINKGMTVIDNLKESELPARFPDISWSQISTKVGMICTAQGIPILNRLDYAYPITSLQVLRSKLSVHDFRSPLSIVKAHSEWNWLPTAAAHPEGSLRIKLLNTTFHIPRVLL